ncbi:substrate-binding domain-containing protein [Lentibacter algarum]|uniref:substrate-binding domain-containing protein n=1 Tax=Lentibacter algarum TaxID=576131 RepID=UPI001C0650DD|nr:substrate-binding domain-containing protein [Lentibacter algarum]MBU2980524.1 substrate-binding domain-containing protein [Lentibacter algarum]
MKRLFLTLAATLMFATTASAESLKLAVTTSFHNSGLSDILLPEIKQDTGLEVQLIVVGTGQALRLGAAGDVDAILVHSRKAEDAFLAEGNGTHRREIMYNDFVIIGPESDPAAVSEESQTVINVLQRIADEQAPFVSRGDDSGTHKKELALWSAAGITEEQRLPRWYKEAGAGMGASLNTASGVNAYILADRASWLNFGNKGTLKLLFAGDPTLFNQYAYIPVNPAKHGHVKHSEALALEAWLTGPRAAELINNYKINGETLFTFNAEAMLEAAE